MALEAIDWHCDKIEIGKLNWALYKNHIMDY
jgi:hypothetical protein